MVRQSISHGGGVSSLSYLFGEPSYLKNPPPTLDLQELEAGLPSHRVSRVKEGGNPVIPHSQGPDPLAATPSAKKMQGLTFESSQSARACLTGDELSNWGDEITPSSVTQASFSPKRLPNGSGRAAAGYQVPQEGPVVQQGRHSQLGESQLGYLFGKD